ncbi:MAG: polysaccharide biosynthesis/export family protein [Muribaculaceae bacterium]|nr:polysaccharide biosynthesis/export family protein [Muribaculaceae bacterium]
MKTSVVGVVAITVALLCSCSAHKKVPLIQNADTIPAEILAQPIRVEDPILQPGDMLNIEVTSTDPIATAPFNKGRYLDAEGKIQTISRANGSNLMQGNNSVTSTASTEYYLIDKDGNINFPIVGEIHLAGLTKDEAQDEIVNSIYPKYLKIKPTVDVRFMNFRVTVLGAVGSPGIIVSPNERINIFEALAMAGDLDIQADRENILLVRTHPNGTRETHRLDVHDKNMLFSPYLYLQPNDMIYVNYNRSGAQNAWQISQGFTTTLAVVGGLSSVTALVISIINLTK